MENPNSWSPLQREINQTYWSNGTEVEKVKKIHQLLQMQYNDVTLHDVEDKVGNWQHFQAEGECWQSLACYLTYQLDKKLTPSHK